MGGLGMSTKKSSAVGPYLGFGLQTVRYCARLLSEPEDSVVCLEKDDDVSVHYANGDRLLEQTKSGTAQNPISDWAKDLWKTIHNWLTEESPSSDSIVSLCLYVAPVHTGNFVLKLHQATTESDAAAVIAELTNRLKALKQKPATAPHVKELLEAATDDQVELAKKFKLITQTDPLDEIRQHFKLSLDPVIVDRVVAFAIGKAKNLSDQLLRSKKPAALLAGDFQKTIRDFIRHTQLPTLELFATEPPDSTVVKGTFASRPTFIRQLELIEISENHMLNAVSDFLHASSSKAKWGCVGTLLPESLDQWNDTLCRRHNAIHQKGKITNSHLAATAQGAYVYWECLNLNVSLDSRAVPNYFVSGCFNDLADRKVLGWHPQFEALLK